MKEILKKIDNFICNKFTIKNMLYILLSVLFLQCYNYFVIKYSISNIDNLFIIFAINFSTLFWIKVFKTFKDNE